MNITIDWDSNDNRENDDTSDCDEDDIFELEVVVICSLASKVFIGCLSLCDVALAFSSWVEDDGVTSTTRAVSSVVGAVVVADGVNPDVKADGFLEFSDDSKNPIDGFVISSRANTVDFSASASLHGVIGAVRDESGAQVHGGC